MTAFVRAVRPSARRAPPRRAAVAPAAAALLVSAWVHADLADPPWYAAGQVTLAGLFVAQAVVAALVALWLLVRPGRVALVAAVVVGLASWAALVGSVYVRVPSIGPLPVLYEPFWYGAKVVAAVAAAVAASGAAAALVGLRTGPVSRTGRPPG